MSAAILVLGFMVIGTAFYFDKFTVVVIGILLLLFGNYAVG